MSAILQIIVAISILSVSTAQTYGIRSVVAGLNGKASKVLQNGFTVCPPSQGISFECLAPESVNKNGVTIEVNGKPKIERNRRYFAYGNKGDTVYRMPEFSGDVTVQCYGYGFSTEVKGKIICSDQSSTTKTNTSPTSKNAPNCVTVKGTDYVGELKLGWVRTGGTGVTFRPNSSSGKIVGPEYSVLTYKLQVPTAAKYAIVVDMGTKHPTEHNDIWLKCDGFFRLWKNGQTKLSNDRFIKVYHNRNGRAKEGVTIDFEGWSISTRQTYSPGKTYTCYVGARSTMTTLYGIIGFPCNGKQCERTTTHWTNSLSKCNI